MSSHREAPEISKDPVADNTDTYAFVSPDQPNTVTMISNYVPLEEPPGGPNFFEFGEDVLYEIKVDNDGDGLAEITYQFRFQTETRNPNTFLYNTGQITSISSPNWNRPQFYSVTKVDGSGHSTVLGSHLACPPCNIGPRSTPNYPTLAGEAVHKLSSGEVVFAGQRAEGFYVDLGSIFDLADLRPFQNLHLIPSPPDRKSTRLNSSHVEISYAVFCLKKKTLFPAAFCPQTTPPTTTSALASTTHTCELHLRPTSHLTVPCQLSLP